MENSNIIESILAMTFFENEELFKKERNEYPTSEMERYHRFRHFIREMDETDVEIFKILSKNVEKECCKDDK